MSIGDYAFYDCSNLINIQVGNNVTNIGACVFSYCRGLTTINYTGTKAQWNAIAKSHKWNRNIKNYIIKCIDGNISK